MWLEPNPKKILKLKKKEKKGKKKGKKRDKESWEPIVCILQVEDFRIENACKHIQWMSHIR
jgi:hypothetical protein